MTILIIPDVGEVSVGDREGPPGGAGLQAEGADGAIPTQAQESVRQKDITERHCNQIRNCPRKGRTCFTSKLQSLRIIWYCFALIQE